MIVEARGDVKRKRRGRTQRSKVRTQNEGSRKQEMKLEVASWKAEPRRSGFQIADCRLQIAEYRMRRRKSEARRQKAEPETERSGFQISNCKLQIANCKLQIAE
jgi:hypothetical protein